MHSNLFNAPQIDSATLDHYLARGRRERARAFSAMIRTVFSRPSRRSAEVHPFPAREQATRAPVDHRRAA